MTSHIADPTAAAARMIAVCANCGHLSPTSGLALMCSICWEVEVAHVGYLKRANEETVTNETIRPGDSAQNRSKDDPHHGSMSRRNLLLASSSLATLAALGSTGSALGQSTGGSAVLPRPEPRFGGVIGRKSSDSKPDFPRGVKAPAGAPNVLLIMTDDTGFGAVSTFGGPITT